MSVRITETNRSRNPQPGEVVAVLCVTKATFQDVTERLDGFVSVAQLGPGPDGIRRYRLDPRPNGQHILPLSPREQQVLEGASLGKENSEIAADLVLSVETVRTHVKNVLRKLDARDRAHAVHIAHLHGILLGRAPS